MGQPSLSLAKGSLGKKGQEELVGFVLVVALVAIAGLILLGIALRWDAPATQAKSADIARFLESAYAATSECRRSSPAWGAPIGELVTACASDSGARCRDGASVCRIVNTTLPLLVESSWPLGSGAAYTGYRIEITAAMNRSAIVPRRVMMWEHGTCGRTFIAGEQIQPGSTRGTIVVTTLKLCTGT